MRALEKLSARMGTGSLVSAGITRILMDHLDEEFHSYDCLDRYRDWRRCTCEKEVVATAMWLDSGKYVWTHPEICECDGCLWVG